MRWTRCARRPPRCGPRARRSSSSASSTRTGSPTWRPSARWPGPSRAAGGRSTGPSTGPPTRAALRKELAGLPGLDTYLTAGSPAGVADGLPTLLAERARTADGEPGYEPRLLVGGGLVLAHLPELQAAGVDAFHIGGAARPSGWEAPVDPAAVAEWRGALEGVPV
ncbi:hypothetical protein SRIMM317S_05432 [Streptomyces rimosus subsp. rimosus]